MVKFVYENFVRFCIVGGLTITAYQFNLTMCAMMALCLSNLVDLQKQK